MKLTLLMAIFLGLGQWAKATDLGTNWGAVTGYTQQSVVDLVASRVDNGAAKLGQVQNCKTMAGDPCGIYFNVAADSEKTSPLALELKGQSYKAKLPGALTVKIYDSLTEDNKPLVLTATLQSGDMVYSNNSGQSQLVFGDKKGSVTLAGTIQGQVFSGVITYSSGSKSKAVNEQLGQFTTNICSIFACQ